MSKYRKIVSLEIIVDADDAVDAENKFQNMELGALNAEQKTKMVSCWDFRDADPLETKDRNGDWKAV